MLQAALMANTEVLKEPRGFIRLIEFVSKHFERYCSLSVLSTQKCTFML